MHFFTEAFVLFVLFTLYWLCGSRRKYLRRRIGDQAVRNVYNVARNIGFMLSKHDIRVQDNDNKLAKGGILYSFHFGIWEMMPRALRKMGYNIGILVNKYAGNNHARLSRYLDDFLEHFRSAGGVAVFSKNDTMKIVRFLDKGGILGVLVDGNHFYAKKSKIEKLGKLCGVPLVPFAAYRERCGGVLDIGCDLDRMVGERPLDYVWFYKSRTE
jgi:lauroyl/myristoyl acyltransferase